MKRAEKYLEKTNTCIAGTSPACARVCPLGVNLLGFINKCRIGSFSAAWKELANTAVLPAITCHICTHPCMGECVRKDVDQCINILSLEQYCFKIQKTKPLPSFFIPAKKQRIMIVGSGPAGLTCAAKLAAHGFPVDIYEKESVLGGSLNDYEESILPKEALDYEINRISNMKFVTIHTCTEIAEINKDDYSAVIIATGSNDSSLTAKKQQGDDGIFLIGSCNKNYSSTVELIHDAAEFSTQIENFVKIGQTSDYGTTRTTCDWKKDPFEIEKKECAAPADVNLWNDDTAKAEASRCEQCSCNSCFNTCHMMQWYNKDSKALSHDLNSTIHTFLLNQRTGLPQVTDCYMCGLCEDVCPEGISFGDAYLDVRRFLNDKQKYPLARYDYWMDDIEHANSSRASAYIPASSGTNTYLFFPGCQLTASMPESTLRIYSKLNELTGCETGALLHCCGAPLLWTGQEKEYLSNIDYIKSVWENAGKPEIVTACPTCSRLLKGHIPEAKITSLWTLLADLYEQKPSSDESVHVFDPCSTRNDYAAQDSVRKLLKKIGYNIIELHPDNSKAQCCGFGGLIKSTNSDLADAIALKNTAGNKETIVTYCSNCQDSFSSQGINSRHILSLLFKEDQMENNCNDLSVRKVNREAVKEALAEQNEPVEKHSWDDIRLLISDELKDKMNRMLITEDNLKQIIEQAEKDSSYIIDTTTGYQSACLLERNTTFWVSYKKEGDAYRIENAYYHRLKIGAKEID